MTKDPMRLIAIGYAVALAFAALLNYIPGLTDGQGRVVRHLCARHLR